MAKQRVKDANFEITDTDIDRSPSHIPCTGKLSSISALPITGSFEFPAYNIMSYNRVCCGQPYSHR